MPGRRFSRSAPDKDDVSCVGLPSEVRSCLHNARYLHLGTCADNHPHVSLMNYTFISADDAAPFEKDDIIVMTSQRNTKKFENIIFNARVSILVHDWITPRNTLPRTLVNAQTSHLPPPLPTAASATAGTSANSATSTSLSPLPTSSTNNGTSVPPAAAETAQSGLSAFLHSMNHLEISSISATLNGTAEVLEPGCEKAKYFQARHLASNPPDSRAYIESDDVAVIIVRILSARVADIDRVGTIEQWKGEEIAVAD